MNTTFSRWGSVALALCLNLLAGCAYRGGDVASAAAEPVSAGYSASQGQASGRLLVWTADFSVDEAHVYATPLTDSQIAQLAKGEKPTGSPIAITPAEQRRPHDLARMGWAEADLPEVPSVKEGESLLFTFARVLSAFDAKRQIAQPFQTGGVIAS